MDWRFALFSLGGVRVAEICANALCQFFSQRNAAARDRWWLEVIGKGIVND